jgi:hypothetical protein
LIKFCIQVDFQTKSGSSYFSSAHTSSKCALYLCAHMEKSISADICVNLYIMAISMC